MNRLVLKAIKRLVLKAATISRNPRNYLGVDSRGHIHWRSSQSFAVRLTVLAEKFIGMPTDQKEKILRALGIERTVWDGMTPEDQGQALADLIQRHNAGGGEKPPPPALVLRTGTRG